MIPQDAVRAHDIYCVWPVARNRGCHRYRKLAGREARQVFSCAARKASSAAGTSARILCDTGGAVLDLVKQRF